MISLNWYDIYVILVGVHDNFLLQDEDIRNGDGDVIFLQNEHTRSGDGDGSGDDIKGTDLKGGITRTRKKYMSVPVPDRGSKKIGLLAICL